jgi:NAD-dependent deacetylase
MVYPAAALPLEALEAGAVVVEINPHSTPLTPRVDFALAGSAGEVLRVLEGAMREGDVARIAHR